jgi:uncharacterized membrane protein HdeD (DUF308 family)
MPQVQPASILKSAANFSMIEGALLFIGGAFLLFTDTTHKITFLSEFTGALLVIAGMVGVVRAMVETRVGASWIGPVIAIIAGLILLLDGQVAGPAIVRMIGAFLATFGVIQLTAAFVAKGHDQRGLILISGLFTLGLGIAVFAWPACAMVLFTICMGIWLVLLGFLMFRAGWAIRRATR